MQKQKGITLIVLIITVIVMLILVGASVAVALKGGLFLVAKQATNGTKNEISAEETLSDGRVKIDRVWYDSLEDYLKGKKSADQNLPKYADAQKNGEFLAENAKYESDGYTAVIPKGFKIIDGKDGDQSIAKGLVIEDAKENEFVWIPVTETLQKTYASSSSYIEPSSLTYTYSNSKAEYDSQETLNYLYGDNYYNYSDFKYKEEYEEMVDSVNANSGFYIGRYETTIDETSIGSKAGKTVLTADKNINGTTYPYRWYGLYAEQKKADVTGNGIDIQTAMIYGVLWDQTMSFIKKYNNGTYDVNNYHSAWHTGSSGSVKNSGTANSGDVALNIWDLESNAFEWTQEGYSLGKRISRGGDYNNSYGASGRRNGTSPTDINSYHCSRLALYIKN